MVIRVLPSRRSLLSGLVSGRAERTVPYARFVPCARSRVACAAPPETPRVPSVTEVRKVRIVR
ncbi:hypothetical protein GCM10010255_65140 [Streptomyces coeruleofuscus]|uniref:Uncharacterized protein n=1 Tax=Streptomyces coeruleofuscus TaxID=66879 RepID=A0ABP5W4Q5_9ACTN